MKQCAISIHKTVNEAQVLRDKKIKRHRSIVESLMRDIVADATAAGIIPHPTDGFEITWPDEDRVASRPEPKGTL